MGWKRERTSALNYSVHYLSYRPRSVAEVVFALKKKKYLQDEIDEAITELLEKGLLDDKSFSESWINYRKNQSVRSRSFVRQELHTKGVAPSIIEMSLEEYYPQEEERAVLLPLLERQWESFTHRLSMENCEEIVDDGWDDTTTNDGVRLEKIAEKLLRKYAGKGFSPYLVREVLAEVRAKQD